MFIYFIRSGTRKGPIKIGITGDIESRMNELQIGNPAELTLVAAIPIDGRKQAQRLERDLHKVFAKQHIRGEWFKGHIKLSKATSVCCEESVPVHTEEQSAEIVILSNYRAAL